MRRLSSLVLILLCTGCAVGPKYRRPAIDVPGVYRGGNSPPSPGSAAESLGNEKWSQVFKDPVLQQLIRTALQQNYDVKIATARILQAQAVLGITRANQFPMAAVGGDLFTERNPKISSSIPTSEANAGQVALGVIWNLDFWGKYRRETEAARARMLATEWGRRAVLTSVVSSVASSYFQLRELDSALQISKNTLDSRKNSLHLTNVLAEHGSASLLDVRQSEELVYTAAETIPDLERQIAQQEDFLSILLGEAPGTFRVACNLQSSPCRRSFPRACLLNCWNAVRI